MNALKLIKGFLPFGNARIYFETAGSGRPLVFLHAGVSDRRMWDPQFEFFADRYQVIRYDSRGIGETKMPDGPWSMHEDLHAVLAHVGVEHAALVGCSAGGVTAVDFAVTYPQMVRALVLSGSGLSGWKWSPEMQARIAETIAVFRSDQRRAFDLWASLWIDGVSRDPGAIDPAYRDRARAIMAANYPAAEAQMNPARELDPPSIDRLGEIKTPTLVILGELEPRDLHEIAELLASKVPGAKRINLPNTAHLPSLERPSDFNRIVAEFLSSLDY